jgi:hypothetical protein
MRTSALYECPQADHMHLLRGFKHKAMPLPFDFPDGSVQRAFPQYHLKTGRFSGSEPVIVAMKLGLRSAFAFAVDLRY